jgi:hypothetical protein
MFKMILLALVLFVILAAIVLTKMRDRGGFAFLAVMGAILVAIPLLGNAAASS